jgi:hypothetical protein
MKFRVKPCNVDAPSCQRVNEWYQLFPHSTGGSASTTSFPPILFVFFLLHEQFRIANHLLFSTLSINMAPKSKNVRPQHFTNQRCLIPLPSSELHCEYYENLFMPRFQFHLTQFREWSATICDANFHLSAHPGGPPEQRFGRACPCRASPNPASLGHYIQ